MPRDPRKHQKALMKKRSKQKAALQRKSQRQEFTSFSPQAILRRARDFPFFECRISANWQKEDLYQSQIILLPVGTDPTFEKRKVASTAKNGLR